MSKESLIDAINDLSLNLIDTDISNADDLTSLMSRFNEIISISEKCGEVVAVKAASKASSIIQRLINKDGVDIKGIFDVLSLTITALQEFVINNRPIEEIAFPEELGLTDEDLIVDVNKQVQDREGSETITEEVKAEESKEEEIKEEIKKEAEIEGIDKLQDLVNELSSIILLADSEKMEDIVVILNSFEAIKNEAQGLGQKNIYEKAQDASETTKRLLFEDITDKKAMLDTLYQMIKYMQGILYGDTSIVSESLYRAEEIIEKTEPERDEPAVPTVPSQVSYSQRIIEIINDLSSKIGEADLESLQDIANIHTIFEELHYKASEEGHGIINQEAVKCLEIARKMVMDEVEDKKSSFDILRDASKSFDEMINKEADLQGSPQGETMPLQAIEEPAAEEVKVEVSGQGNLSIMIEELVKALGSAEIDSLQDIANIHSAYETLSEMTALLTGDIIHQASVKCTEIAKKMVMDEVENKSASFNTLYITAQTIKDIVINGRPLNQAVFPEELGIVQVESPLVKEIEVPEIIKEQPKADTQVDIGETKTLRDLINEISSTIASTDLESLQDVANLNSFFEDAAIKAIEEHRDRVNQAAVKCAEIAKKMVMGDAKDINASFKTLLDTYSVIKEIVIDGKTEDSAVFPEDIGIAAIAAVHEPLPEQIIEQQPEKSEPKPLEKPEPPKLVKVKAEPISAKKTKSVAAPSIKLPKNVNQAILSEFLVKQDETLEVMESAILDIEEKVQNGSKRQGDESFSELKRLLHTLKGESGMLGLNQVSNLCHVVEDYIEKKGWNTETDKLLDFKDWLSETFHYLSGTSSELTISEEYILQRFSFEETEKALPKEELKPHLEPVQEVSQVTEVVQVEKAESEYSETTAHLEGDLSILADFVNEAREHLDFLDQRLLELETDPENIETLNAVFRVFHTIKGTAGFLMLSETEKLAHHAENLLDNARSGKVPLNAISIDIIFDTVDMLKILIDQIKGALDTDGTYIIKTQYYHILESIKAFQENRPIIKPEPKYVSAEGKRIGEILIDQGSATKEAVDMAVLTKEIFGDPSAKLGQFLVKEGIKPKDVAHALRTQSLSAETTSEKIKVKKALRVDADRLDAMVDTIGELVIIASMISQDKEVRRLASKNFLKNLALLDKITKELQNSSLSMRMVPVKATFQKMARMVRDLAKKSDKKIDFAMNGEDTELDSSVIEMISDPLIHLVRNAIDHGIESNVQERIAAGKKDVAKVSLHAFHKGGNVYIQIRDDGRGLDKDIIYKKAVQKGLIKDGQSMADSEIYNLIFLPGFSTKDVVTDVSGRGVGMDVVKRNIESLRGTVEIETHLGKGSIFSLRLPLTLAIIDGMLVNVGKEIYIIPTISIVESLNPKKEDIMTAFGTVEMIKVRGELMAFFRLASLFDVQDAKTEITRMLVVVVEDGGNKAAIAIDNLLGQQSTVIKSLGENMQGIPGISGGTILSNGQVGIIIDVAGIVKLAKSATAGKDFI